MKRKRSDPDPAWRPAHSSNRSSQRPVSTESLLQLMGVATSPAKSVTVSHTLESPPVFKSNVSKFISPSRVEHSTPSKGPLTSHVITPGNSKLRPSRLVECNDGTAVIFLSESKTDENTLPILMPNEWLKNNSPIPSASFDGKIDFEVTKESIERVREQIQARLQASQNRRVKSQRDVMKISARDALLSAGYSKEQVPAKLAHWIHFIPHEVIGDEGQTPDNLGLGLKYPNGAMELINRALLDLLFHPNEISRPKKLYLSAIPQWVEGFENIRLLKSLTYTVKNEPGEAYTKSLSINFDMLSLSPICLTEVELIKSLMEKKFLLNPTPACVSKNETISDEELEQLLCPSSPLIFSSEEASSIEESSSSSATPLSENSNRNTVPSATTVKLKPTSLNF